MSETRWVPVTGAENIRDLGGLPLAAGGVTRSGVLFRGDTLQELTADDVALFRTLGLRTVIDLRTNLEATKEGRGPLADEPIRYANLPFMPDELLMPSDDRARQVIVAERREQDRVEHYLGYLKHAGDRVVAAVQIMAEPDGPPALFHCAAGKDRTGVLAALVLDAVGVQRDAIVADFVLTNERLERVGGRLRRMPTYANYTGTLSNKDMSADPQTMTDVLAALDDRDGGAAGWLLANGLTEAQLASLRAALTG
ncbi:MAG TPA: tyrosine-protein phosphatase [Frankiaceae bacterium]|jgi:protein tyrosine/serine phosphatase|nr:tyrosine-protein phosphatase [Frankiaceae bacterium]